MSCINVTLTQKQTGLDAKLSYKEQAITVSIGQICNITVGYPIYAADSRLYAADGPLYVNSL